MRYHGHIYYDDYSKESIEKIYQGLKQLELASLVVCKRVTRPIGPHPLPMIEIHFEDSDYFWVKKWLEHNRGNHSVILHEDTDHDVKDHSEGALWLGNKVEIDFGFFKT